MLFQETIKYYLLVLERMTDYDNLVNYIQHYKNEVEAKKAELNQLNKDINCYRDLLDSYKNRCYE